MGSGRPTAPGNLAFMGSDYPSIRSSTDGLVRVEGASSLPRHLGSRIEASRSGRETQPAGPPDGVAGRDDWCCYAQSRSSFSVRACWWPVAAVGAATVVVAAAARRPQRRQRAQRLRRVRKPQRRRFTRTRTRTVAFRTRNERAPNLRPELATGLLPDQSLTRIVRG